MRIKRAILTFLSSLLLIAATPFTLQDTAFVASLTPGASAPAATYLINQRFEGTGYDNSETWTETGSTVDEDSTITVLDGSQSLRVTTVAAEGYTDSPAFSSQTQAWIYFLWRPVTLDGASYIGALFGGGAERLWIRVNSDGTMRIDHGSVSASTVNTVTAGTTYHIWARYQTGSGANGQGDIAFSTDGTKPTSGDNFASLTTGTETTSVTVARLGNFSFNRTIVFVFDKCLVDDVNIGSNPP